MRVVEPAQLDADLAVFLDGGRTERALWRPGTSFTVARLSAWRALLPEVRGLLTRPSSRLSSARLSRVDGALGTELLADERTYGPLPSDLAGAVRGVRVQLSAELEALKRREIARANSPPRFIWPIAPVHITSRFGRRWHPILHRVCMHAGVDLRAVPGQIVHAAEDGVVIRAGRDGGYGLLVELRHRRRWETRYAHLSAILVAPNQTVKRGDPIGFVGSTGLATGPHLHFEVRHEGRAENPLRVLGPPRRRRPASHLVSRRGEPSVGSPRG